MEYIFLTIIVYIILMIISFPILSFLLGMVMLFAWNIYRFKGLFLGLFVFIFWWLPFVLYPYVYQIKTIKSICTPEFQLKVYLSPEQWKERVIQNKWKEIIIQEKILIFPEKGFKSRNNEQRSPKEIIFNGIKYNKSVIQENENGRIFQYEYREYKNSLVISYYIHYDLFLERILFSHLNIYSNYSNKYFIKDIYNLLSFLDWDKFKEQPCTMPDYWSLLEKYQE